MGQLTKLLAVAESGDAEASAELFRIIYQDLKSVAAGLMNQENPGQTLQPTALVHEAWLRLMGDAAADSQAARWENRRHFFAAAATAMRRILIEAARRKSRTKHGGGRVREPLDPDGIAEPEMADDLLALDDSLQSLAKIEPQIAELVNLRYFAGLTIKEAASALGISPRTADMHWAYARAWLLADLQKTKES